MKTGNRRQSYKVQPIIFQFDNCTEKELEKFKKQYKALRQMDEVLIALHNFNEHEHRWQFVLEVTNEFNARFGYLRFACECGKVKWVKRK